jgi:hypothetical protein
VLQASARGHGRVFSYALFRKRAATYLHVLQPVLTFGLLVLGRLGFPSMLIDPQSGAEITATACPASEGRLAVGRRGGSIIDTNNIYVQAAICLLGDFGVACFYILVDRRGAAGLYGV